MGDGKKLKELIERKRTNVRRIAKATGIPATTLYSIIQKDSGIRLDLALKLANELETEVNEICSTGLSLEEYPKMTYERKDILDSNIIKMLHLFGKESIPDVMNLLISFYQLDNEARKEVTEMMKIKLKYHKEKKRIEEITNLKMCRRK